MLMRDLPENLSKLNEFWSLEVYVAFLSIDFFIRFDVTHIPSITMTNGVLFETAVLVLKGDEVGAMKVFLASESESPMF